MNQTTIALIRANVIAVVPLLMVSDMERALAFYVHGMGFNIEKRWLPEGHLRWCRLSLGAAALMLQEATEAALPKMRADGVFGNGISLYFSCADAIAIYRETAARGVHARHEPQVGNFSWEVFFMDPDGYQINFSSPTHLPEETLLSDSKL